MINNSISDRLAGALCYTLLHSLWLGVVLAILAGLIIICTRSRSSMLRYNLLISALGLFGLSVSVIFAARYLGSGDRTPVSYFVRGIVGDNKTEPLAPGVEPAIQPPQQGITEVVYGYLNDHHNAIALVWFLVICARSVQLGVGLYGTYRLRRVRVSAVTGHWSKRMQQLAAALGIRQTIALLESGLAKAPVMIGYLKPVILVPVGLLTALSAGEVEAILIHELAHIRRRDYLVNLLQNGMEIVFFFNPAVLWISALIRAERENCCDDLALAQNNNRANYIRALVSCEEYQSANLRYAMAFFGGQHMLLRRVKRLAGNRNHSLTQLEKTVLAVCLVGVGLFMMAFSAVHRAVKIEVVSPRSATPPVVQLLKPIDQYKRVELPVRRKQLPVHIDTGITLQPPVVTAAPPDVSRPIVADNYPYQYPQEYYRSMHGRYIDQQAKYLSDVATIKIDLMRDNLVSDTNHLHFTINDTTFILNGIPQSPEVFQRYKAKYNPTNSQGWGWTHGTERDPEKN